jgi:hypothetical protein
MTAMGFMIANDQHSYAHFSVVDLNDRSLSKTAPPTGVVGKRSPLLRCRLFAFEGTAINPVGDLQIIRKECNEQMLAIRAGHSKGWTN